ncbi:DegV family protein [Ureaplasma sp. ES3154-GEN]|uniref:DegV family protein n=1 Tax=Ureaplasma sp. ES3154-GEN TaxID=2984844 RepID=UPI0021E7042B|nr:DegV family protein [Ureaplasma sp. ES3154-GEN]MCV3743828.1 DegV family protein [Ureaplasma sp. ES3154-GEN]
MKQKFIILTDSSSTVNPNETNGLAIRVLPLTIMRSDEKLFVDEPTTLPHNEVFAYLNKDYSFMTSTSLLGTVHETIAQLAQEYERIIYIGISKGFSSQYNNLKILEREYPNQLIVEDSQTFGYALEYLAELLIKTLSQKDLSEIEIRQLINQFALKTSSMFVCKDIKSLVKSGRISKIKGVFLKMTHISPIIKQEYKNHYGGLARKYDEAYIKMVDLIDQVYANQLDQDNIEKICILHANLDDFYLNKITSYLIKHYGLNLNQIVYRPGPNVFTVYTREKSYAIQVVTKIKKVIVKEYYPLQ